MKSGSGAPQKRADGCQTGMMSHAVYARGQRVLFLPEVSSEWCSSCRDMNPVGEQTRHVGPGTYHSAGSVDMSKKGQI